MRYIIILSLLILSSCSLKTNNSRSPRYNNNEVVITDYGADPTGHLDCSVLINKIIANFPISGGVVVIPEGTFVLDNPIIVNRNYITIRGLNSGMRSNIDVDKLEDGSGPGGGSKLVLRKAEYGIHISAIPDVDNLKNRISGVEISNLLISGGEFNSGVGIFFEHDNDRCTISNVVGINLSTGIIANAADAMVIKNSWLCEMQNGIEMNNGIQNTISGCQLGTQPNGITCKLVRQNNLLFNGNHVYPNGKINLLLEDCSYVNITSNNFKSYYNRIIDINGDNNLLSNNIIWLTGGSKKQTSYNGDDYGIVRINGKNNFFTSSSISCTWNDSIQNPVCIKSLCGPNKFTNLHIDNINSTRVFSVQNNDIVELCVGNKNIFIDEHSMTN